jgi:uncharacterized membrane protein
MSWSMVGLAATTLLASAVEFVEAFTIVLAMGLTRGWRSTLAGTASALAVLTGVAFFSGYALINWFPKSALQLVVGSLLLVFGLQWLRKAILRSAGLKAKHDELETYEQETEAARAAGGRRTGLDGYSFTIAFKGVLLEGLEVAFIVLTFGSNQHRIPLAAAAAGVAVLLVVAAGFAARGPLARAPENTMKFAVGVMLTSFGIFWGAEGAGAHWPGSDAALLAIIPGLLFASTAMAWTIRRSVQRTPVMTEPMAGEATEPAGLRA